MHDANGCTAFHGGYELSDYGATRVWFMVASVSEDGDSHVRQGTFTSARSSSEASEWVQFQARTHGYADVIWDKVVA